MRASRPVGLWFVVLVATVIAACGGGDVVEPETGVSMSAVEGPPAWPVGATLNVESASTSAVVLRWPRPTENGLAPIFKVRRDGPSWVGDTSDTPVYLNDGLYRYAATQGLSPCTPKRYRVELWYLDAAGAEQNTGTFLEAVAYPMAPIAPSAMPGALDPVAQDFYEATRWLYEPTGAVQSGFSVTVDAGWKTSSGVVRGAVRSRSGSALGCAAISVVGHPEYGATTSREDGTFSLAVRGGQVFTIKIAMPGYYQVFRTIESRDRAFVWTNEARLTPIEGTATTVSPASASVLFSGPTETDVDGTRTARLFFLPGTTAQVEGEPSPRTSFAVRAKEYTVGRKATGGDSALAAMPADLPPTTGFTWAAELSLDGLEDKQVTFNRPVWLYLDNFLGLPQVNTVGGGAERVVVPVGSWDATKGAWVPETNGYIAKVLSVASGVAQVDLNGDGVADTVTSANGDADHLAPGEAEKIGAVYAAGAVFWRVPRTHFSPVDCNLALVAADTSDPNAKLSMEGVKDPNCTGGSVIECENRTLGEEVPLSGTPFSLKYSSARQPGRRQVFRITMPRPMRDGSPHPDHVCTEVRFSLAGHNVMNRCARGAPPPGSPKFDGVGSSLTLMGVEQDATTITARVSWDGRDNAGRPVLGTAFGVVQIGFAFRAEYAGSASFGGRPTKAVSGSMVLADGDRFLAFTWTRLLLQAHSWNDSVDELGQWTLDAHHWFDPAGYAVHYGGGHSTGAVVPIDNVLDVMPPPPYHPAYSVAFRKDGAAIVLTTPATGRLHQYKDGTYTEIGIAEYPTSIAMAPDGDVLVTKAGGDFCGRIDRWRPEPGPQPPGYPKCVANCPPPGSPCYTTDPADGDAKKLPLRFPNAIAVAPDGTTFIADGGAGKIFRIDPAGKGSTFQDAPNARGVAVGPDGTVYWSENGGLIYKLAPTSTVRTQIARDNPTGSFTEGGEALWTRFQAWSMAVDSAGYLTFSDVANHRVRRLVDGKLYTVAGNGTVGPSTNGAAATRTPINTPQDLVFGGDGSLYVVAAGDGGFRRIHAPFGGLSEYRVPSEDGAAVFVFDARGVHKKSVNAITGVDELVFAYDASGRKLTSITDAFGNTTNIYRDSATSYRVRAPFGQETTLTLAGGVLTRAVSPGGLRFAMEYTGSGASTSLLSAFWDPSGNVPDWQAAEKAHRFTYDGLGHLQMDSNPTGGAKYLTLTPRLDGFTTDVTTMMGRKTTFVTRRFGDALDGSERRVFSPTGTSTIEKSHQEPGFGSEWQAAMGPTGSAAASHSAPDPRFGSAAKWVDKVESYPWANPEFYRSGVWKAGDGTLTSVAAGAAKRPWFTMQHTRVFDPPSSPDPTTLISAAETWTSTGTDGASTWSLKTYSSILRRIAGTPYQWESVSTDPSGRTSRDVYDAKGLLRRVELSPLAAVEYDYDGLGRLVAVQQGTCPGFGTAITTEDCRRTSMTYVASGPAAGSPASITDPLGRVVTYTSDAEWRPTSIVAPGTIAARTLSNRFSAAGDLEAMVLPAHVGAAPVKEHRFTWDSSGRPVTYDPPVVSSNPGLTYGFNLDDQLVSVSGAATASLAYDPTGLLTGQLASLVHADGTTSPTYADDGSVKVLQGPRGDTHRFYFDGPLLDHVDIGIGAAGATALTTTLTPQWDKRYLRPTGLVVTPAFGSSASIEVRYDDDPTVSGGPRLATKDGLPIAIGAQLLSRGSPERNDALITETNVGGVKTSFAYNIFGELAGTASGSTITTPGLLARFGASTNIYRAVHERDRLGRLTALVEEVEAGASRRLEFDYWPAGWLKSVGVRTAGGLSLIAQYTYDANGNRLGKTTSGGTEMGVYNDQDQLTTYAGTVLTWANGRLVQTTTGSAVTSFTYDGAGNLVKAQVPTASGPPGITTVDYLVDAMGRRIGRKEGGGPWVHWIYAPGALAPIAEVDASGAIQTLFVYGLRSNVPDYVVRGGQTFKVVTDHLGSVRRVLNVATGLVVQRVDYDDDGFGKPSVTTDPSFPPIPFAFAGGIYDAATGLVHFNAREYWPRAGIWTTRDPVGLDGGLNLYQYAAGDPVNFVDPEGTDIEAAEMWFIKHADKMITISLTVSLAAVTIASAGTAAGLAEGLGGMGGRFAAKTALKWGIAGAGAGAAESILKQKITKPCINWHDVANEALAGAVAGALAGLGPELRIGNVKIAPFGNAAFKNPYGRWPHYHYKRPHPSPGRAGRGEGAPGQGFGRHRPWEPSRTDRSFWDRFF